MAWVSGPDQSWGRFGGIAMAAIEFFAKGTPKGQPRPRAFARNMGGKMVARVYDAGTAEGWKGAIAAAAIGHIPATPLEGPLSVDLAFVMPRPKAHFGSKGGVAYLKDGAPVWYEQKPDADNLAKAVMDALTALGAWKDDSQVVALSIGKQYGDPAGVMIYVESLNA